MNGTRRPSTLPVPGAPPAARLLGGKAGAVHLHVLLVLQLRRARLGNASKSWCEQYWSEIEAGDKENFKSSASR